MYGFGWFRCVMRYTPLNLWRNGVCVRVLFACFFSRSVEYVSYLLEIRTKLRWSKYSKALDIDWTSIIMMLKSMALYLFNRYK